MDRAARASGRETTRIVFSRGRVVVCVVAFSIAAPAIPRVVLQAQAACLVKSDGSVRCDQDTTTTPTTDKNGARSSSSDRTQRFNDGTAIVAEVGENATISGAGLALVEGTQHHAYHRSITMTNDGRIFGSVAGAQGAVRLSGDGGDLFYRGTGSVTNSIGFGILAQNKGGSITIIADGPVTAGAPSMPTGKRSGTPPAIKAIENGAGDILIGGAGDIVAPDGRGLWGRQSHTGRGSVDITGSGDVTATGAICPGIGHFQRQLAKGKTGCSAIRAEITNPADHGDVVVDRSGNIAGTSAGINAITFGNGNVSVTTGANATVTGKGEFGIEAKSEGKGSIAVRTRPGGSVVGGGDGIIAINTADWVPARAHSTIDVETYGAITSGSFAQAALNPENPTGVPAGISAGYVGGEAAHGNVDVHGTVIVDNHAIIMAQSGVGILGYNFGPGSLAITTAASITASGGSGIATRSTTGSTSITIVGAGTRVSGSGLGNAAVAAETRRGPVHIDVGPGAELRGEGGAAGIRVTHIGASITANKTITNGGLIAGGALDTASRSHINGAGVVGGGLTIVNFGTIRGGAAPSIGEAYAMVFTGGFNSVGGPGLVAGGIDVGRTAIFAPALPGSPVGERLAISGPLRFASTGTYRIRLTSLAADAAAVDGAAYLDRADLRIHSVGPAPTSGTGYLILTATSGIVGRFGSLSGNLAFYRPVVTYGANDISLTSLYDYRRAATTPDARRVGAALNHAYRESGVGAPATIFVALDQVKTPQGLAVLDALSGEGLTAAQNLANRASGLFTSAMFDRLTDFDRDSGPNVIVSRETSAGYLADVSVAPVRELADLPVPIEGPGTWRAWSTGFAAGEDLRGSAVATQNNAIYGGALGVDYRPLSDAFVGVAVGGSDAAFSVPTRATSGTTTGGHAAVYDLATIGAFYGASSTAFSYFANEATRAVTGFGGLGTENERSRFASHEVRSRLEFGRHFDGWGFGTLTPFLALEIAELRSNGFGETALSGPGLFRLNVSGQSGADIPAYVGLRYQTILPLGGFSFLPSLQVAYVHEFAPYRSQIGAIADLPGSTFLIDGARPARDAAQANAGGELKIGPNAAVFANFDGEFSGVNQLYAGKGGFRWVW